MTVNLILTSAGNGTGPFNLFSNIDSYTTPFLTNISRTSLLNGIVVSPSAGTTTIRIKSTGICTNSIDVPVSLLTGGVAGGIRAILSIPSAGILRVTYSGGTAPYTYIINGTQAGSNCAVFSIDFPNGTSSTGTVSDTGFTIAHYLGSSYTFQATITDHLGVTITSNLVDINGCLILGTKITTQFLDVNIETLQIGDLVIDKDKNLTKVTNVEFLKVNGVIKINEDLLISSKSHIHLIKVDGELKEIQAEFLNIGDILVDKDDNEIEIISLENNYNLTDVVNISTESQTYIANNILTHNKLTCQF